MPVEFKRVPAIDRCYAILHLFAGSNRPLGISEIARELGLYKGTVFNAVHTLAALEIFAGAAPDLAILEVGLGGRLDAVNKFPSLPDTQRKVAELDDLDSPKKWAAAIDPDLTTRTVILKILNSAHTLWQERLPAVGQEPAAPPVTEEP